VRAGTGSRRLVAGIVALVAACAIPAAASGAELIGRNATQVRLAVSTDGRALVSYFSDGRPHRTLAWGAVNAIAPTTSRPQVALRLDYSGGWKSFGLKAGELENHCGAYDGPQLHWMIASCKAPDGSYWVLQTWQRALPNYGVNGAPFQRKYELWLSHWKGPLPVLEVNVGWTQARYHTLFGRFTYLGKPIHGFGTGVNGRPTDSYGRVAYVDTLASAYGAGWKRENSFVTHRGSGAFCYGFFPHGSHPSGMGTRYRFTIQGPGVMPDMYWEGVPPALYDKVFDIAQKQKLAAYNDPSCG
jgi:hypothetical protein